MIRISRWLFAFLLPVFFIGGCGLSVGPLLTWRQRTSIKPLPGEIDKLPFPILYKNPDSGRYQINLLKEFPESTIVTGDFDEDAINRDLRRPTDRESLKYLRVLSRTDKATKVSLDAGHLDGALKSWYEVEDGKLVPKAVLRLGPMYPLVLMPGFLLCGVAAVGLFLIIFRRKSLDSSLPERKQAYREIFSALACIPGIGAGIYFVMLCGKIMVMLVGYPHVEY